MTSENLDQGKSRNARFLRWLGTPGIAGFAFTLVILVTAPAAAADVEAGRRKAEPCAACHGRDGNATVPGTPSLAGQPVFFTHWQLIKYRDGRRKDPQMSPPAQNLSDEDMADLAAYYRQTRVESFFTSVTLGFSLTDPAPHYHLPLLISPFAVTTYRGS